jgi:hypothetical protein
MRFLFPLIMTLAVVGCGMEARQADRGAANAVSMKMDRAPSLAAGGEAGAEKPLPDANALQRKIIYTAEVDLVVEDFAEMPSDVATLTKQFGGYVAGSTVTGSPGRPRRGQWTLRVPVARYEEFLAAVQQLGEVRSVSSNSEDVSEEFYDLQARIRNKRQAEQRLLKHLEDSTGKLEEILKVELELDRVREEIERMEGRLRVLNDLTSLTTVTLRVDEIRNYVPEEAVTYATRVRRAFATSIDALVATAKNVSIAAVAASPWLGVLLVPLVLLVAWFRLRRRRRG